MNTVTWIIVLCWIILMTYWTICAFSQKRRERKANALGRAIHGIIMAASIFLLILSARHRFLDILIIEASLVINVASVLMCILGLLICIWARKILADNWDAVPVIKKGHELITDGPYRFVRHPIYSGILLMFLGTALAIGMLGSFVSFVILFIALWIKLRQEEKLMIEHFKGKYLEYMKRTNALIPGLM